LLETAKLRADARNDDQEARGSATHAGGHWASENAQKAAAAAINPYTGPARALSIVSEWLDDAEHDSLDFPTGPIPAPAQLHWDIFCAAWDHFGLEERREVAKQFFLDPAKDDFIELVRAELQWRPQGNRELEHIMKLCAQHAVGFEPTALIPFIYVLQRRDIPRDDRHALANLLCGLAPYAQAVWRAWLGFSLYGY